MTNTELCVLRTFERRLQIPVSVNCVSLIKFGADVGFLSSNEVNMKGCVPEL